MTDDYSDIINMKRPVSATRKHMSNIDRGAQFAPFAALTGYSDMVDDASDRINAEGVENEPVVKIYI